MKIIVEFNCEYPLFFLLSFIYVMFFLNIIVKNNKNNPMFNKKIIIEY